MDTVVRVPAILTCSWLKFIDMPFFIVCVVVCTGTYDMPYRI